MRVTYFLNGPMVNLLFYCHVFLYWQKMTSYEKFSHNLAFKVPGKFLRFNTFDESIKILKNSWVSKNFNWNINRKTYYKAQTTSHLKEIIQPPPTPIPPDKILLRLWNKRFLREIYRNVQTCFQSTSRM